MRLLLSMTIPLLSLLSSFGHAASEPEIADAIPKIHCSPVYSLMGRWRVEISEELEKASHRITGNFLYEKNIQPVDNFKSIPLHHIEIDRSNKNKISVTTDELAIHVFLDRRLKPNECPFSYKVTRCREAELARLIRFDEVPEQAHRKLLSLKWVCSLNK